LDSDLRVVDLDSDLAIGGLVTSLGLIFEAKHVSRKWFTLVDSYKKALTNNSATGHGPSRFHWIKEMEDLIGGRHDVNFIVTGTQDEVTLHRPDELQASDQGEGKNSNQQTAEEGMPDNGKMKSRKRKQKADDSSSVDKLLSYMKEADEKAAAAEEKMLSQILQLSGGLLTLMEKVV